MITFRRILLSIIVLLLAVMASLGIVWKNFLETPVVTDVQGVRYNVHMGASFKSVATDLHNLHILKNPYLFMMLVCYRGDTHHLKAGEYLFPKGTTPGRIIAQIATGTGMIFHSFTIIPGMTFSQLRQALDKSTELAHTTQNLSNAAIMQRLGHTNLHPEGQFFPDTYYFVVDSSDIILLKRAFNAMQIKLNTAWLNRAVDVSFKNSYEALIAASIIEKEANVKGELPIIAGVLANRLRHGIMLQFDPTVIYGIGSRYDGTIYKHVLQENNPYNTYLHKGLPPTPISMPGKEAIEAVMHPDENNYLYFVARGDGRTHQFSRTLGEHNAAVVASKKYSPWFFNTVLVKKYLLKSFTQTIFNTN
jgi:UPF0755 protein